MTDNPQQPQPVIETPPPADATRRRHIFGSVRLLILTLLIATLVTCLAVAWSTRDAMAHLPFLTHGTPAQPLSTDHQTAVDLHPWQTAQALEPLAVSSEEVEFAREAERLADHEVDQAFATALRLATTQRPALTPEATELQQRIVELQQAVKDDQQAVQQLTPHNKPVATTKSSVAKPTADKVDDAASPQAKEDPTDSDGLAVAKAQLALDSDQLTEAQQDFARASGDQRSRIQQELSAHEALMAKYDARSRDEGQVAVLSTTRHRTFFARVVAFNGQRNRYNLIQQAMQQAQQDARSLAAEHDKLAAVTPPATPASSHATQPTAAKLADLKTQSAQRQLLAIYNDRVLTQQQLATVYQKWSAQVLLQHRILLHLILQSVALICFIIICIMFGTWLVRRLLARPSLDPRSARTLRSIIQFAVQFIGVVCILLVIFGVPSQMSTILGFATAGLTVALQQFILAFIGWFILMGRNGIRIGDAVEINGIGGEVLEIGLFRTTLLETGNWTDKGHPTGRRVTFVNNFAVTGQYFNFSTTGQWMWDEIKINVPASDDSYNLIERIHQVVLKETEKDAAIAEEEWKRATRQHGLKQFTADPSVNLRPAASGTDVLVRYVTRASDRFETRNRIYQSVLEVLHSPTTPQAQK